MIIYNRNKIKDIIESILQKSFLLKDHSISIAFFSKLPMYLSIELKSLMLSANIYFQPTDFAKSLSDELFNFVITSFHLYF